MRRSMYALLCLGLLSIQAQAEDSTVKRAEAAPKAAKEEIEVFENFNDLVLVEKDGPKRLIAPKRLSASSRYVVRMKREVAPPVEQAKVEMPKVPTQAEQIEARRLLFEANQAFFKGDLEQVWTLVDRAEALDPDNYRIKSMKGSLLYRIGSKDLAVSLWQESLAMNPNQPEIKEMLDQSTTEATSGEPKP